MSKKKIEKIYLRYYKFLLIIPIIMFLISILMISKTINDDGTPIYRDVSLKGGVSMVIQTEKEINIENLKEELEKSFPKNSFVISELTSNGKKTGFLIDTDGDEELIKNKIEKILELKLDPSKNYSSNFISPTLSLSFFKQVVIILIISLILMSLVIFLYFKELVPSSAVIISAIFDIIVTIGILDLFQVQLSIAGIGTLLMIIGYSIDTDVLLTNRLIREKGKNYTEKLFFAFKTGTLMSATTIIAAMGALILTNSNVISQIALIMIIGIIVDYISTWLQNAGILFLWLEKKGEIKNK